MRKIFFLSSVRDLEQNKNIMNFNKFSNVLSKLGMNQVISLQKARSHFDHTTQFYENKNISFIEFKGIIEEIAHNVYPETSNDRQKIFNYLYEEYLICNEEK